MLGPQIASCRTGAGVVGSAWAAAGRCGRRTAGQRHVLWIVSHPETIEDRELDSADLVLVASRRFADHLRDRTDPTQARERAERGRQIVLANHTFDHRARHLIDVMAHCA